MRRANEGNWKKSYFTVLCKLNWMWKIFQVNPNAIRSSVAESSAVWRTMLSCCFFVVPRHQKIELTEHLINVWSRPFISGRAGLSTIKKQRTTLKTLMSLLWLHSALCMRTHLFFFLLSEMKTIFETCSSLLSQHY